VTSISPYSPETAAALPEVSADYRFNREASVYGWLPGPLRRGVVGPLARALPVSTRNFSLDFAAKRFVSGEGFSTPERHAVWMGSFAPAAKRRLLSPDLRRALAEDDDFETVHALWSECDAPDELRGAPRPHPRTTWRRSRPRQHPARSSAEPVPRLHRGRVAVALPPSFKVRGLTAKFRSNGWHASGFQPGS
jgi:hypothetical protein